MGDSLLLLRVGVCRVAAGVSCRLLQRSAGTVHQARKKPLYVLVVVARARVHHLNVPAHAFEKTGDVGVHAGRLVLRLVFGVFLLEDLGNVVDEKRSEQDLVFVIQTPATRKNTPVSFPRASTPQRGSRHAKQVGAFQTHTYTHACNRTFFVLCCATLCCTATPARNVFRSAASLQILLTHARASPQHSPAMAHCTDNVHLCFVEYRGFGSFGLLGRRLLMMCIFCRAWQACQRAFIV